MKHLNQIVTFPLRFASLRKRVIYEHTSKHHSTHYLCMSWCDKRTHSLEWKNPGFKYSLVSYWLYSFWQLFTHCKPWFPLSQVALVVKNLPANAGDKRDVGSISELERCPRGGYGNPLQYSCLENPMDRGDWEATVHRVTKSWTRLKQRSMNAWW